MKLLLDTHVFLWYISADGNLPTNFREAIQDSANEANLSVASVWEAVIKHSLGKLPLPHAPADFLPHSREAHRIASLPIQEADFCNLQTFPRCIAIRSTEFLSLRH